MAILGSSIDPRLQLQDYSGFVNAAQMQAQGLAGLGQQISQASEQYKQYKQEQKEALKRVKQAEVFGNAITTLLPETKGSIGAAIEKLRDPNIPLYERDAIAQSISSIANIGVAQQEIGLKREQLGLEEKLAKQKAELERNTVAGTVDVDVPGGKMKRAYNSRGEWIPFGGFAAQQTSQTGQVPIPNGDFDNPPGHGVPAFQETRSFPQLMYDIYDEETMNLINKASSENPNLSDQELMAELDPTFKEIAIYSANAAKQAFDAEGKQAPSNYLDPNFIRSAIEMRGQMPPQGQAATGDANAAGIAAASRLGGIFIPTEKTWTSTVEGGVPILINKDGDKKLDPVAKKIPDDMRLKNDGSGLLEVIPGSEKDLRMQALQQKLDTDKKTAAAEEVKLKTDAAAIFEKSNRMVDLMTKLEQSPGFNDVFGFGYTGFPGSKGADSMVLLEQIQALGFMEAIKDMKGMGALSNAEGEKASAAFLGISPKMSEKAAREKINEVIGYIKKGQARLQTGKLVEPEKMDQNPVGGANSFFKKFQSQ